MVKKHNEPQKDIRVVMNFKNNLILAMMEKKGYKTVADLSRAVGIGNTQLGELINMKELPTTKEGEWRVAVVRLSDFFKCLPTDLFSEFQQETVLEKNRGHAEVHFGEIQAMLAVQNAGLLDPVASAEREEMRAAITQTLDSLPTRLQMVLRARFGIDGPEMTLDEVGKVLGVGKQEIHRLETKALRHLRKPSRSDRLRDFVDFEE